MLTSLNITHVKSPTLQQAAAEARGGYSLENPAIPLSNPTPALIEALGGGLSTTGITVTERKAMQLAAVYACVRILAESLASLPLVTYQRLERGKQRAPAHPVYKLLHDRPNPEMTPFQFKETLQGHAALTGNGYAEIEWNNRGNPIALWPITPERVTVARINGEKRFKVTMPSGETVVIARENMLHIPGFGYDGLVGHNPIALMRQSIALAMAAEEFGARFFGNGSQPGGVLTYPGKLSKEAQERLKGSWESAQGSLSNAHRVAVLAEGMTWTKTQIDPNDAQFLETRNFQVTDICRIFRVPPHMVAQLDKATFSNIEQQSIEFVTHTLQPWAVRWEEAISYELFSAQAQATYFAEFLMDALLRGDMASRYTAYKTGRDGGWLCPNDIREAENMNPVEGGDVFLVPMNMVPADKAGALADAQIAKASATPAPANASASTDGGEPDGDENRSADVARWRMALAPVFADAAERVAKRESVARDRAEKRSVTFAEALDADHESGVAKAYAPAMRALVALAAPDLADVARHTVADKLAALHAERHVRAVKAGEAVPDPLPSVFADLDEYFPSPAATRTAA